ncbi:MAG: hypothetical protein JWQ89_4312 [Devosia sp.]|uniref:hypothetical protein n=1 Tax=Devosia sp. TaxID=1871048 RepID=UPI0026290E5B|nr:hypothetical protein [Devosia sp.]MDB5542585.1 hypothetical protein [Devosia sp.]
MSQNRRRSKSKRKDEKNQREEIDANHDPAILREAGEDAARSYGRDFGELLRSAALGLAVGAAKEVGEKVIQELFKK